jgi:hypothetical protein
MWGVNNKEYFEGLKRNELKILQCYFETHKAGLTLQNQTYENDGPFLGSISFS